MKILPTVYKLLFFKTTDLCTLNTKIWKKHFKFILDESWKNLSTCRQLKYQLSIGSKIFISLDIILYAFNIGQYRFPL